MVSEAVPSLGPAETCEVHDWPDDGLAARLVAEIRRRKGKGSFRVCRACIARAQPPEAPSEPTRQAVLEAIEARAAHRALEVFTDVLCQELGKELGKVGVAELTEVFGRTEHVHYAVFVDELGGPPGAVRHTFRFFADPSQVAAILEIMGGPSMTHASQTEPPRSTRKE